VGASIAQLGRDLSAVVDAVAPEGPIVLAGHSMGGMTIMAAVEQGPGLFGGRLAGVALIATSSADLDGLTFGAPPAVALRIRTALPRVLDQGARLEAAGRPPLPMPYLRPLLFGRGAARHDVRRTVAEIRGTSLRTMGDFLPTFLEHQRTAALVALRAVPVVLLCGDRDRLTPLAHSKAIARALPQAQFHVYPGAGHMLQLERAEDVSRRLVGLAAVLPVRPLRAAARQGA
jgi:pimeloyl-ACP methyl ester carboxylesterase